MATACGRVGAWELGRRREPLDQIVGLRSLIRVGSAVDHHRLSVVMCMRMGIK